MTNPPTATRAAFCVLLFWSAGAFGIIDAKFTPVQLAGQSELILCGRATAGADKMTWELKGPEVLKGKMEGGGAVVINLTPCDKDQVDPIRGLLAGPGPVLVFARREGGEWKGWLHAGGTWIEMMGSDPARWDVRRLGRNMDSVFAGGTDMLARMTRHILADPNAKVPVSVGFGWMEEVPRVGKVNGEISGMEAVEVGPGRQLFLFVGSAAGDRLYRAKANDEVFEDATAASKIDTKSRRFVWIDLDGDGQAELVSWDGRALSVRRVNRDGGFAADGAAHPFEKECLGLAACNAMPGGTPAVLVSRSDAPVLVSRDAQGRWQESALPGGAALERAGRALIPCIVADFDNDGRPDVLQPRERGGVMWKGGPRGFAEPVPCAVANAEAGACSTVGDFDQDGRLDVFIGGGKTLELWENAAEGDLRPVARCAGSLSYRGTPGPSCARALDLNHDGRTDLCLLYPKGEMAYHFSRGFRCFGEENELRLTGAKEVEGWPGQAACAVADFNRDGALDLAVGFVDGQVACFYNDAHSKAMLRLSLGAKTPGPVTAAVTREGKAPLCLGAASVSGGPAAYFPVGKPGEYSVRWKAADGAERVRKVTISAEHADACVDVSID